LALYYVQPFLPSPFPAERNGLWLFAGLGILIVSIPLGAVHLSFKEGSAASRLRKGTGVTMAVLGLISLIAWSQALPSGAHIEWREDIQGALADAERTNTPLIVDFGADWCGACIELQHQTLSDPRVVAAAD